MLNWYIAKTKPQKERFLVAFLATCDVETFYPEIVKPSSRTGGMEPLFPSYLFCQMDPQSPKWPIVRWAPGVSYFLSTDGKPTEIPESLIEYLHDRIQVWNGGEIRQRWVPESNVHIVSGPFAGIDCIFKSYIPSRRRCQVLLEVVGKMTLVELPEWSVGVPLGKL